MTDHEEQETDLPDGGSEAIRDRRAPDQDAAIEEAFVAGVLPEVDRREPEATPEAVPVFEWIRRGDGTIELHKDGQRVPTSDTDEIAACPVPHPERPA